MRIFKTASRPSGVVSGSLAFLVIVLSVLLVSCGGEARTSTSASAESGRFAGKTIEWVVPFKQGGGGDTWARFNAPFLTEYLPGHPTVVVKNVPGGGSIKGANLFNERAKPNGLRLLGSSGSTQIPYLLGDPRVQYTYDDWKPVMAFPNGGVVYVSPELGIDSASQISTLADTRLMFASQGPTSLDIVATLAFELLDLDVKTVFGFRGGGARRLAFERGEVAIDYQTTSAYLQNVEPLVKEGSAVPLWTWGALNEEGELVRDPNFPELPHFGEVYEMVHGEAPSGIAWDSWFALMSAGFGAMKLLVVPEETSSEIVDTYEQAFVTMRDDSTFAAKKEDAIGRYDQAVGARADKLYTLATTISQEEKKWIKNWLRDDYNLNIP